LILKYYINKVNGMNESLFDHYHTSGTSPHRQKTVFCLAG
jgi:hypothetical protein